MEVESREESAPGREGQGGCGGKLVVLLFLGLPLGLLGGELWTRAMLTIVHGRVASADSREGLLELRSRLFDPLPMPGEARKKGDEPEPEVELSERTKIIHPFVAFDELGTLERIEKHQELYASRDPNSYRILILGGSVSGIFGLHGSNRLRNLMGESPLLKGREVEVLNYGQGGYKQPQQLIRLMQLLISGIRPDAVLNLDGFNEVALASKNFGNEMQPTYPSYTHWMRFARALGETPEQRAAFTAVDRLRSQLVDEIDSYLESKLSWSTLWNHLRWRSVQEKRSEYNTARDGYMKDLRKRKMPEGVLGKPFDGTLDAALDECVAQWMESSRQIRMLCEQYDMDYLHVLQPTLHDPGAKPMTAKEIAKGAINEDWERGVLQGYPKLRAGGATLAAEGIDFHDATMVFAAVEETLYYDSCHFNRDGNRILAEDIAAAFLVLLAE